MQTWLNIDDLSAYTRFSKSTLYKKVMGGEIPHRKVGAKLIFNRDEIDAWLNEHRAGTDHGEPARGIVIER